MVKLIYLKNFFQLFKYESIFVQFCNLYLIFIFMKKQTTVKPN
jgi:hypothetical protein